MLKDDGRREKEEQRREREEERKEREEEHQAKDQKGSCGKSSKNLESLCKKVKDPLLDQDYRNDIMEDIERLKK
jgi:hypothetical protein